MRSHYPALSDRPEWTYLDSAATTLLHRDVLAVVSHTLARGGSAGRAAHAAGVEATDALESARASVAKHLGVETDETVFVRSATEGLNLVAQGWGRHNLLPGDRVLVTHMEHHSNVLPWRAVARDTGALVHTVSCDEHGDLDRGALRELLLKRPRVLAVTHVSNVTGACVPLREVIGLVRQLAPDCLVVVDGTQAIGHMRVDVSDLGADFYVFSGHKAYGPLGAGVVWGSARRWRQTRPLLWGGGMVSEVQTATETLTEVPGCFEAGTPNHPAIVGLAEGLRLCPRADDGLAILAAQALRDVPGVRVLGAPSQRVGLVSWVHEGVHAHDAAAVLAERGIAVRAGHLCAQPYLTHLNAPSVVRASFGVYNSHADVERLLDAVRCVRQQVRGGGVSVPGVDALQVLAQQPWNLPDNPTHRAVVRNTYCADVVHVGLTVQDGRVTDIGWDGHACSVCRASAQTIAAVMVGRTVDHLSEVATALGDALAGDRSGPFAAFASLASTPSRHTCAQLPVRALRDALAPSVGRHNALANRSHAVAEDAWTAAMAFRARGLSVAIATLIDVIGSSPCPIGSHLVVASNGEFWGAVSGGCVEGAVIQTAVQVMAGAMQPGIHGYQISNSQAGEVGLPCGGQVRIHVGFAPGDTQLRQYAARGRGLARVLDIATGLESVESSDRSQPMLRDDLFVQPLTARPQLVLVGGTRIAQVLETLAQTIGFDVTIIEPREGFAGPGRFHGTVRRAFPGEVLASIITRQTAVVMLTHDERIDDDGLMAALGSPAFYVGALGSRKTQRARLARLGEAGLTAAAVQRLHGPAGLPLGAVGAEEIALSILAEVVAARRQVYSGGVGTVVLAGGRSVRAGAQNKLLQPLRGVPMIRRVVETACEVLPGPCVVVLGHQADRVRAVLSDLPVQFVENERYKKGMGTSIATGIEALVSHGVDAALVVLGDMPYVSAASLQHIADAHTPATQHLVIVPVAGTGQARRRANPVLWPKRYFADLMALTGDQGGKVILANAPGAVLELPVDDTGLLQDVDLILA